MRNAAITLLIVISCLSTAVAQQRQRPSSTFDVALDGEGHLSSRCEDGQGGPVSDATVELVRDRRTLAWTTSGADGSFILRNVKPGPYRLRCGDCDRTIRVWSRSTAPPAARVPIVIVVGVADQAFPYDDVFSPWATGQRSMTEQVQEQKHQQEPEQPLTLQIQTGARQRTGAGDDLPQVAVAHAADGSRTAETRQRADRPEHSKSLPERGIQSPGTIRQQSHVLQEADVPQDVVNVASSAAEDTSAAREKAPDAAESSARNTHAHPTVEPMGFDAPFDPFAGTEFDAPQSVVPQFANPPPPQMSGIPASQPPPTTLAAPVVEPTPQTAAPSGGVRYLHSNVGPTVGDVVVTSFGIAGITMGIVAIHKYDNRRVRRVVSP